MKSNFVSTPARGRLSIRLNAAQKLIGQSGLVNPRLLTALFCAGACVIAARTLPAFFRGDGSAKSSRQTLTFAKRVAYQRAIEDVYWRHRIWPRNGGERPDPKPSLDAVISQVQLQKKVADYLRKSQALEDYWQRPITAEQLQAEMDRMAKQSKQPEVLRELFVALGNDPIVIAECLARPALADRLLTSWYSNDERIHGELKERAQADLLAHPRVDQMKQTGGKYSEIALVKSDGSHEDARRRASQDMKLNSVDWERTLKRLAATFNYEHRPIGKLSALHEDETHYYATAVIEETNDRLKLATVTWVKEPLESWLARAENRPLNAIAVPSASYTLPAISNAVGCTDDTWTATAGLPDARAYHTSVWTGTEMIVWGGSGGGSYLDTGGRYNPSTDTWTAINNTNAPNGRAFHTAIWNGSEMFVWGGYDGANYLNTGGRYDPTTDSWTAMNNSTNVPTGRSQHTAVWTGSEMIVWGGYVYDGSYHYLNTGGRYDPGTDSWIVTSTTNTPQGRSEHTAVWTGTQMIVWGGNFYDGSYHYLNTGGRYDPGTDSWTATSTTNAPEARYLHTAVWTGSEMIVWGGQDYPTFLNTGGRYNPATDNWTATAANNAPSARAGHTVVWTGSEMVVWGGYDGNLLNTGGTYTPGTDSWVATSTTNAPAARDAHTAVWTGKEMIVWGGGAYPMLPNTGGRYSPSMDSWTATGANNAPSSRALHTAVWTGSELIVWGGYYYPPGDVWNTGGRYNLATDSWTATNITNAPEPRYLHTAVWTGTEMIIWGGSDQTNYLSTGGRYNPGSDSWTPTSTNNAPIARWLHTAVWTGSEMVIWGGYGDSGELDTGAGYNPSTDAWIATSPTNAPAARASHTAIWTGSEMIVWGGWNGPDGLNSGGRYNPVADSWTATSETNAPAARYYHTVVWTGSEMIVWGGYDEFNNFNTGGRYNPSMDSWGDTSITDAPSARFYHTALWTGNEMIAWGGGDSLGNQFNTGGKYDPGKDRWTATSTANGPVARRQHTAVWTGSEMVVWGGYDGSNYLNTGARYCAQSGPTPTPTASPTATPSATASATPRFTPTPRPRPTPAPRP